MIIPDWKKFEQLAAAIQRELAPDTRVTENAKLMGKSDSERQIDILIEQETGQFKLRIAIDCKDYKEPVDVKDVEAFIGLIEDVEANKGAMIAANGFTATAKSRALGAGLDLFRLIDTADHKWRSYVSIPAVQRDFQLSSYSFTITGKGRTSFDLRQDFRYMPILRSDGSLIDYACNLVAARWEDETIPAKVGEHRDLPLVNEPTFFQGPDFRFEANITLNALGGWVVTELWIPTYERGSEPGTRGPAVRTPSGTAVPDIQDEFYRIVFEEYGAWDGEIKPSGLTFTAYLNLLMSIKDTPSEEVVSQFFNAR